MEVYMNSRQLFILLVIEILVFWQANGENVTMRGSYQGYIRQISGELLLSADPVINFIKGEFGISYSVDVSCNDSYVVQYTYNYPNETLQGRAIRVHVNSTHAVESFPVLFVVKQQLGIMSWQIPLFADNKYGFPSVSRTLCPVQDYFPGSFVSPEQTIFVDISSSSKTNVTVSLKLNHEENFYLTPDSTVTAIASPSQPRYFKVNFTDDKENFLVKVSSINSLCATVSIQNARCPVFDLDRTVQYNGSYQTMTKRAAIVATRSNFPDGFFIVLIVKSVDDTCTGKQEPQSYDHVRQKNFTIELITALTEEEYWIATFGVIGVFLLFYLFAVIVSIVYCIRGRREDLLLHHAEACANYENHFRDNVSYGTITPTSSYYASQGSTSDLGPREVRPLLQPSASANSCSVDSDSSLDETDIDLLHDADSEKEIVRTKTFLYVSDLARKTCKTLRKKSRMYSCNVLTIAILYALPVVQLVLTYQQAVNITGNQDVCYYNFMCAHPRGYFNDFNHVYSNIGYILLGFLFLSLVWRRDLMHKKLVETNHNFEKLYGIPHHFGLFYAMAVALMMEGLLSACYHVCPNYTNFQFDTAFMYMIAGLCMLKIYQTRHPDINADAYRASLAFALVVLVAVIGVLYGNMLYWFLFAAVHILSCLALSAQIYYMGRWNLNLGVFKRIYLQVKNDVLSGDCFCRPMYMDRMILLSLANITNWSIAVFGLLKQPKDFPSYLLSIFMVNLVLYLAFYIIMKLRHGEKFLFLPKLYILLSSVCWAASLYFFVARKSISWELTPAQSREKNRPCEILNFYDDHDIWHFLSAASMFFSFMILLTMDDDLMFTPRSKIPVF